MADLMSRGTGPRYITRTIYKSRMRYGFCPHCETMAIHYDYVVKGAGEGTCLQCIADGNSCCSLSPYGREA